MSTRTALMIVTALAIGGTVIVASAEAAEAQQWQPLFNGKDLSGWTIKIAGRPLNDNYADTFRVEDGVIKVSYDGYDKFDSRFATSTPTSHIRATSCDSSIE